MNKTNLHLVVDKSEDDLLAVEVENIRKRFQRFKSELNLGTDGSADRGQVAANSSHDGFKKSFGSMANDIEPLWKEILKDLGGSND